MAGSLINPEIEISISFAVESREVKQPSDPTLLRPTLDLFGTSSAD